MQIEIARRLQRDSVRKLLPFLALAGLIIFVVVSIVHYPLEVITLLIGLPALFLVINEKTRFIGLMTIFALAPFTGIIKVLTGVRYAPLVLDSALLLLVTFLTLNEMMLRRLRISFLDVMVFLFIALAAAQMFNTYVPDFSIAMEGFRFTAYQGVGFFIARFIMKSKKQIKQLMLVTCYSATLVAFYGIKQFFLPASIDLRVTQYLPGSTPVYYMGGTMFNQMRAFSTMSGPFHLGIYIVLVMLLLLCLFQCYKRRIVLVGVMIAMVVTLLLNATRSNWIGLIGGLFCYLFLQIMEKRIVLSLRVLISVCASLIAIFVVLRALPYFPSVYEYILSVVNIAENPHLVGRIASWEDTFLPLVLKNPFGYGTGTALDTFMIYITHNWYVKIAIEMGLLGLTLFVAILLSSFILGLRTYRKLRDNFLKMTNVWILSFIVAISVVGLGVPIFDVYPANLYFWFLVGLMSRLRDIESAETVGLHGEYSALRSKS